jgi:hypothetical protein
MSILDASWTTWLFVRINPSGVNMKPEPPPCISSGPRPYMTGRWTLRLT